MTHQRINKPRSWSPPTQRKTSEFAPRPFAVPAQQNSDSPPSREDIENDAFAQHKFEATGLKIQEKNGTLTPEQQERLVVLQAKMDGFWAQRNERASPLGFSFANIAISPSRPHHSESNTPWNRRALAPNSSQERPADSMPGMSGNSPDASRPGAAVLKKQHNTGLPDTLKSGVETLSGMSMDDVRVHYNSTRPAQLAASAYTQGTDIHVGCGQERHLAHEAWHVVQQRQGRVRPTVQAKGVSVNDDTALEREADVMGAKAVQLLDSEKSAFEFPIHRSGTLSTPGAGVAQLGGRKKKPKTLQRPDPRNWWQRLAPGIFGGKEPLQGDTRSWWQSNAPKLFGGQDFALTAHHKVDAKTLKKEGQANIWTPRENLFFGPPPENRSEDPRSDEYDTHFTRSGTVTPKSHAALEHAAGELDFNTLLAELKGLGGGASEFIEDEWEEAAPGKFRQKGKPKDWSKMNARERLEHAEHARR